MASLPHLDNLTHAGFSDTQVFGQLHIGVQKVAGAEFAANQGCLDRL